jgi:hypothetical protein
LREADATGFGVFDADSSRLFRVVTVHFADHKGVNPGVESFIGLKPIAQRNREGQHHLPVWHQRQDIIDQVRGGFRLAFGAA